MILMCALFLLVLIGYLTVAPLPELNDKPGYASALFKICLAIGSGFGITSSIYFLWVALYGKTGYGFIFVELILVVVLLSVNKFFKKSHVIPLQYRHQESTMAGKPPSKLLLLIFCGFLVWSFILFIRMCHVLRHGGWDAWQTWNLLARFIYRGGDKWIAAINDLSVFHHPDYPLLIPASVARLWQYAGGESQFAPICIAGMFLFASIGLLFAVVTLTKGRNAGCLAAIVLMSSTNYLVLGAYQYADIPIGFFYLSVVSLILFQDLFTKNYYISLLAGVMAGFGCWTKNEGILFLLAVISIRIILMITRGSKKTTGAQLWYFLVGAGMVLTVFLYFKCKVAPGVDLFMKQSMTGMCSKFTSPSRYLQVLTAFVNTTLNTNPLFFIMLIFPLFSLVSVKLKVNDGLFTAIAVMVMMYAGYLGFYIVTPYDLDMHLSTSLSRLLMQLWPAFILAIFSVIPPDTKSITSITRKNLHSTTTI